MNILEGNVILKNELETLDFSKKISSILEKGVLIALNGEMASGKTVFSKGIIKALSMCNDVPSPTFNIVNIYEGKENLKIYHFDFYRLETVEDLLSTGYDDYLNDKNSIILIEWANMFKETLPRNYIEINFEKKGNERKLKIKNIGKKYEKLVDKIIASWK